MTKDGLQISDLMYSQNANAYVAVVFDPGVTKDGAHFGLSVSITTDKWSRLLQELPVPTGWVAGIVDRNGIVIARTRGAPEFVGKRLERYRLNWK